MKVAALAGRRIDPENSETTRFPLANSDSVRRKLRELMLREKLELLVCSAACGSDLLALDAALETGVRCKIVIPYAQTEFRHTSVTDRPGNWGPIYDSIIASVASAGDLMVLTESPDDVHAFNKVNEVIVRLASNAAAPDKAFAIIVWEGEPRESEDMTSEFRHLAITYGMTERMVLTCST